MATRTIVGVEVLTVTDCPHREMALDRVRQALDRVGASRVVVIERVIDDPEVAAEAGMHGSPTVLIDGHDPFTAAGVETSVSCRLFPTVSGFDGAPSVEDLVVALSRPGPTPVSDAGHRCNVVSLDGPDAAAAARRLGVLGFVALWRGERLAVASLCDDAAVVEAQVQAGRLEVDDAGLLVGVHGLVARTTRHRIDHAAGAVHTWCALDAVGIPAALAIDATAVTSCPACQVELRVDLREGEPVDTGQPLRLWLPEGRCDHLVEDFCSHANLYCSPEHLTATVPKGSPGRMVTAADAAAIGHQTWDDAAAALGGEESGDA